MKKYILSYILFLLSGYGMTQTKHMDSLNRALKTTREDVIKIKILNALAFEAENLKKPSLGLAYLEQDENLAEKINYGERLEETLLRNECCQSLQKQKTGLITTKNTSNAI